MMKTTKRVAQQDLETIISGGKAEVEIVKIRNIGRPKNKVNKKQCLFYLPENIIQAINDNCRGNKTFFAEEVFRYYFDAHKIEY